MKQEVVQGFLSLPGIAGVALMDGRSRPYFCGLDQILNSQQKEALALGIQQVIETTPPGLKCFEFQFSGHQVYIYKLQHGVLLLVLTTSNLVYSSYIKGVEQLQTELQKDVVNTIANFRLLAGSKLPAEAFSAAASVSKPEAASTATLKETIAAMNQLSSFTTQYLGGTVVTNYWKTTRPEADWLQQFQIERSAQISFSAASEKATANPRLTLEQQQWIQDWVAAFISRCAKVIRDFPTLVQQQALNPQQKFLLRDEAV